MLTYVTICCYVHEVLQLLRKRSLESLESLTGVKSPPPKPQQSPPPQPQQSPPPKPQKSAAEIMAGNLAQTCKTMIGFKLGHARRWNPMQFFPTVAVFAPLHHCSFCTLHPDSPRRKSPLWASLFLASWHSRRCVKVQAARFTGFVHILFTFTRSTRWSQIYLSYLFFSAWRASNVAPPVAHVGTTRCSEKEQAELKKKILSETTRILQYKAGEVAWRFDESDDNRMLSSHCISLCVIRLYFLSILSGNVHDSSESTLPLDAITLLVLQDIFTEWKPASG